MRKITYKFNVGDLVKFKDKFPPTASCGLGELAGEVREVVARADYNGPAYKLAGFDQWFKESCFAGRYV